MDFPGLAELLTKHIVKEIEGRMWCEECRAWVNYGELNHTNPQCKYLAAMKLIQNVDPITRGRCRRHPGETGDCMGP